MVSVDVKHHVYLLTVDRSSRPRQYHRAAHAAAAAEILQQNVTSVSAQFGSAGVEAQ